MHPGCEWTGDAPSMDPVSNLQSSSSSSSSADCNARRPGQIHTILLEDQDKKEEDKRGRKEEVTITLFLAHSCFKTLTGKMKEKQNVHTMEKCYGEAAGGGRPRA
eukprot:168169-Hanusia_phi.AAC.1